MTASVRLVSILTDQQLSWSRPSQLLEGARLAGHCPHEQLESGFEQTRNGNSWNYKTLALRPRC